MRRLTQTNIETGNCWQTAIACILDLDPAAMPDQAAIEGKSSRRSFHNALLAYLELHHGLFYSELFDYQFSALRVKEPGYHLLLGPTERTPVNGQHHAVVGRYGQAIWDPHPSRAGLVAVERWGLLAPIPERLRAIRDEGRAMGRSELECLCPNCEGSSQ